MKLSGLQYNLDRNRVALELTKRLSVTEAIAFNQWLTDTKLKKKIKLGEIDVSMFYDEFLVPVIILQRNDEQLKTLCLLKWS